MAAETEALQEFTEAKYKYGFVTDIEAEELPPGLDEGKIRFISAKKDEPEWMTEWRLKAYRHWLTLTEPTVQAAVPSDPRSASPIFERRPAVSRLRHRENVFDSLVGGGALAVQNDCTAAAAQLSTDFHPQCTQERQHEGDFDESGVRHQTLWILSWIG